MLDPTGSPNLLHYLALAYSRKPKDTNSSLVAQFFTLDAHHVTIFRKKMLLAKETHRFLKGLDFPLGTGLQIPETSNMRGI